jgi:hypothetical protein
MSTLGIFNSTNFTPEEVQLQSFQGAIFKKFPGGQTPLLGFTSMTKTGTLQVPQHTWEHDSQEFPHTATTAQVGACAARQSSEISVVDATQFVQGAILQVNGTMEHIRVLSVLSEFKILAMRGYGTIPPQVIPAGTELWRVGSAFEESSLRPQARTHNNLKKLQNVTQIFRDAWAVSGTAAAMELSKFGENPLVKNKREAGMQHATDMEMSMIFGQRLETNFNGQPLRKMDGILSLMRQYAPDNYHAAPSVITMSMLEDMLDPCFDFNTDATSMNDRVLFCGKIGRKAINKLGQYSGEKQIVPGQSAFGHRFTEFITTRGNYKVMEHPLFNLNPDWARMVLVLDLSSLKTLYMKGRNTTHRAFNSSVNSEDASEAVDAGIDAEGGSFLTESTLELSLPEANAVITGICDVACEPCPTLPTTYSATFAISHPCVNGPVAGGTVVTLSITGDKASQAYNIVTPTGIVTITADGAGDASTTYTLPAYQPNAIFGVDPWGNVNVINFSIAASSTLSNVLLSSVSVSACVKDPCDDSPTTTIVGPCIDACETEELEG